MMPPDLVAFLNAIPAAATNPYALAAYSFTLIAWVAISYRVTRNKNLQDRIQDYPEPDRIRVVTAEMGRPIPPGLTAEEWLRYRRTNLIAIAVIVVFICIASVVCVAIFLERPSTDYPRRLSKLTAAEIQVSSVDDYMQVFVNNNLVEDARFGQTPPWRSIRNLLITGTNAIRVVINNGQYGGCGGTLNFRLNGTVYEQLRRTWSIPMRDAAVFGNCAIEVLTLNFD